LDFRFLDIRCVFVEVFFDFTDFFFSFFVVVLVLWEFFPDMEAAAAPAMPAGEIGAKRSEKRITKEATFIFTFF